MILDGFCDHTAMIADDEIHKEADQNFLLMFTFQSDITSSKSWYKALKKPIFIGLCHI